MLVFVIKSASSGVIVVWGIVEGVWRIPIDTQSEQRQYKKLLSIQPLGSTKNWSTNTHKHTHIQIHTHTNTQGHKSWIQTMKHGWAGTETNDYQLFKAKVRVVSDIPDNV